MTVKRQTGASATGNHRRRGVYNGKRAHFCKYVWFYMF